MSHESSDLVEEAIMKRTALALIILSLAVVLAAAQAPKPANVAGDWTLTLTTPRGDRVSPVNFVQNGETLKVTMTSPRGEQSTGEGMIKGNDIEWKVTRTTPRGEMTIAYKGKVAGDTMSGDAQMGDFGTAAWKAVRKTA
jgi:hypothetical protein